MDEKRKFEDGVHDIDNAEYHSSAGISRSVLMEFRRSPYHYQHKYLVDSSHSMPTPAMIMGNLVHTMVLEPHKFDSEFVMRPEMDRRTNAGKQAFNAFTMTLAGRQSVTYEQVAEADAIQKAVMAQPMCEALLMDCKIEQSIYFTHDATGLQAKSRPDAWNGSLVIDLKTSADASYRSFQNSAFKYGYFIQAGLANAALRSIGIAMEKFVFIVVEKDKPHAVGLYVLDEEAIAYGENQFDELMKGLAICMERNKWPSYELTTLSVPSYAKFELTQEYIDDELGRHKID